MAFDAGAITASLTVDTSAFTRALDDAKAKVKAFEDEDHKVKISAVFDTGSLSRARQMFTQLDQAISKDAMSRLRSSPQGSVLGAINALFSPHQVTGAPSAQQAATQGLLGKMVNVGSSGTTSGTPGTPGYSKANPITEVLNGAGNTSSTDDVKQVLTGEGAKDASTVDDIKQVLEGAGAKDVTTTDTIDQILAGAGPKDTKTTDTVTDKQTGNTPKNTTTTNTVKPKIDPSAASKAAADAKANGDTSGKNWASAFSAQVTSMFSKLLGSGGGDSKSSGGEAGALDKGLLGGIGPGILGASTKVSSIAGLGGAALGALPALGAVGAGAGVIGGGAALLISQNAQLKSQTTDLLKSLEAEFTQAAGVMIKPLQSAFTSLGTVMKQLDPEFKAAFSAAAPLIAPLTQGLEGLVKNLLPGLVDILKAAAPAFTVFKQFLSGLGSGVGQMFQEFSTAIGPSSELLGAFFKVVDSLFPVLGTLGSVMAKTLGPAFAAFGAAIQAVEPFITVIAKIVGQFAGAVLTDLSGALGAVASLLKAIAPAFNTLATSLGSVFSTLESKGAFAQLGDILEGLATPIGNLVKSLIDGLAPAIPPLLTLFGDLVNVVSAVGVKVLSALIPPLTQLAGTALGAIEKVLPIVIPLVTQFVGAFTADAGTLISTLGAAVLNLANVALTKLLQAATPLIPALTAVLGAFTPLINALTPVLAGTITAIATALTAVVTAIPPGAISAIAVGVGGVIGAMKLWSGATSAVSSAIDSTLASSVGGMIGTLKEFQLATEGVTLAEKAELAGMLALDAVDPLAWVALAAVAVAGLAIGLNDLGNHSQTLVQQLTAQDQATGYNIAGYQKLATQLKTVASGYTPLIQASANAVKGQGGQLAQVQQQTSATATAIQQSAQNMQTRLTALSGQFGVSQTQIEKWAAGAGISATKFGSAGESVDKLSGSIVTYVNQNAEAVTSTSSVATNLTIFGNDAFNASTQLDALNSIWNTLVGNLLTKQEAVTQSDTAFQNLKQTITQTGQSSDASHQSFQTYVAEIGSSAASMQKSGAPISEINSYLQTQINHLESLGPLNKGQEADLQNVKKFQDDLANSTNGLNAAQKTMIGQIQSGVITQLQNMHKDTPLVNTDIKNLADSIVQTGTTSASTKSDRATLIKDLENLGLSAKAATTLVDKLSTSLNAVPKTVTSTVTITEAIANAVGSTPANTGVITKAALEGTPKATGGYVSGPGGPTDDSIPAWLSNGEYVVSAGAVQKYGLGMLDAVNAKEYAGGGMVSGYGASMGRTYSLGGGSQWAVPDQRQAQSSDEHQKRLESKLDRLIEVSRQIPAGVGQHVGASLGGAAHDASFRARYPRGS